MSFTYKIAVVNHPANETVDQTGDGEEGEQERPESFESRVYRVIAEQHLIQQRVFHVLQSAHEDLINTKDRARSAENALTDPLKMALEQEKRWRRAEETENQRLTGEITALKAKLLVRESIAKETRKELKDTEEELQETRKELYDTKKELAMFKAEKATTEIGEQLANLKKQLADLQRGAQKSTRPSTASSALTKPSTPKSAQTSRPAWK